MRRIPFPGILNGDALYEFPGLDQLTSARLLSRAATFLEIGESPATDPLLALGTADGGFPLASARLS